MPVRGTTLNTWAIAVVHTLDARGVDGRDVFRRAGIDPATLDDPNGRCSVAKMADMWRLAVELTGDPCLGLAAADFVQPATFSNLGLALLASATLEDALIRSARYSRLVTDAVDVVVDEQREGIRQRLDFRDVDVAMEDIDMFMAASMKMGTILAGRVILPRRVRFCRSATPEMARRFAECFGPAIQFDTEENSVLVGYEDARDPLPMANAVLAGEADRIMLEKIARSGEGSFADRARAHLIARLPSGEPSRADLARALGVGVKTLQRRLRDENATYQALLDSTRRELAEQYLAEGATSVAEVAFRLGFSDQSAFTRAFKRWTGLAPADFRGRGRS